MDLGTEKVSVLFRKLLFPTLAGMLSMCAVTAIDGVFVGHGIGAQGIAAVNICIPILMLFTGLGLMTGIGGSVIASVALSKGKIKYARFNVTQSILFVTAVLVFFVALIMFFPERTAYILGASDHLMPMVKTYLLWFAPSLIFQMWVSVALFIIRLDGAPKLAMWCSVIAAGINTFLGWLFIFPFGWGIMGAAFAATAGLFVGGTIAVVYLLFYAKTLRFYPVKIGLRGFYLFWDNIVSQCRIGSSALLGEATMAVLMFAGNHVFMLYLGDDGVGAFGICCYYAPFVFMVGNAVAQSAQPIISYNFGMNNLQRVAESEKTALLAAIVCGVVVTAVFVLFPETLVGFFLDPSTTVAKLAINGFPYFAAGFLCFILNLTGIGYFQSVERLKPAAVFALLRGAVLLSAAFYVMPKLLGTAGIWLSMPVSETVTALMMGLYCLMNKRQKA